MSSMREHLADVHKRTAAHHGTKAALHETAATHYKALAKHLSKTETTEAAKDSKGLLEALSAIHEQHSQEHANMAEFHSACAEKCDKAADAADLNKIVPTQVSVVAPTRPTITPVLRPGQREISSADMSKMSPEFQKLFSTTDEDLHSEERSVL
jgi:hypothetical protein